MQSQTDCTWRLTGQDQTSWHLHNHSSSLLISNVYDDSDLFWSRAQAIWCCQCFHSCLSDQQDLYENVIKLLKTWKDSSSQQDCIWIMWILSSVIMITDQNSHWYRFQVNISWIMLSNLQWNSHLLLHEWHCSSLSEVSKEKDEELDYSIMKSLQHFERRRSPVILEHCSLSWS